MVNGDIILDSSMSMYDVPMYRCAVVCCNVVITLRYVTLRPDSGFYTVMHILDL